MFPSAFTSLRSDPVNQAYYQHKRNPRQSALGQAVLALAHRRIPPLHASTRNSTSTTHNRPPVRESLAIWTPQQYLYDPQSTTKLPTAARHTTQEHPRITTSGKTRNDAQCDRLDWLACWFLALPHCVCAPADGGERTPRCCSRPRDHGWAALLAYPAPQQPRSKQCLPIDMAVTSTARTS